MCVAPVSAIDSGISNAVQQSLKLSVTKVLKNGRMETTISAEREPQRKNSTDLWRKNGFFSSQVCDFSIQKANLPEMTIFYVNQGYLSYKDNKKICYVDIYIVGQTVPLLNQPENFDEYTPLENEVKICRAKYDTVTRQFLGLENCLGYLTVRGDEHENFLTTVFQRKRARYCTACIKWRSPIPLILPFSTNIEFNTSLGPILKLIFLRSFFFLLCTVDRVEEINQYLGSANLSAIDIDISDFGENFNPSKLDFANREREELRK